MGLPIDPQFVRDAEEVVIKTVLPYAIRGISAAASKFLSRSLRSVRTGPLESEGITLRLERLENTVTEFRRLIPTVDEQAVEQETREPSAERIAAESMEAATASVSIVKQKLLALNIIKRLSVRTETFYELQLRAVTPIIGDLSESQLYCLAAVMLVTAPPTPAAGKADGIAWISETFKNAVLELRSRPWNHADLEYMCAKGLIISGSSADIDLGSFPTAVSSERFSELFRASLGLNQQQDPVISDLRHIAGLGDRSLRGRGALTEYWLTAPGSVIAALVLEHLIDREIVFPEWQGVKLRHSEIEPLVSPFNAQYLLEQEAVRARYRRNALYKSLEEKAPEIVGKEMSRSMRSGRYGL